MWEPAFWTPFPGGMFWPLGLLGLIAFVVCIVVAIEAKNRGREGWWLYLIAAFISPINIAAAIFWFVHARENPVMNNGKPFL